MSSSRSSGYRTWKTQAPEPKAQVNPSSFTDFPDLVAPTQSKTVFQGVSLATKLKEAIAAEEEAAILKRLKKGETPEQLLREGCVTLPCPGLKGTSISTVPDWLTDTQAARIPPSFHSRPHTVLAQERLWKRLGVDPSQTLLVDPEDEEDDAMSLPSSSESMEDDELEEECPEEEMPSS